MPLGSVIDRLKWITEEHFKGRQGALAKAMQCGPPYISGLFKGSRTNPSSELLDNLLMSLQETGVNLRREWLLHGDGEPYRANADRRRILGIPRSTLDRVKPDLLLPDALITLARESLKMIEDTNNQNVEPDLRRCRGNAIRNLIVIAEEFDRREPASSNVEDAEDGIRLLKAAEASVDREHGPQS